MDRKNDNGRIYNLNQDIRTLSLQHTSGNGNFRGIENEMFKEYAEDDADLISFNDEGFIPTHEDFLMEDDNLLIKKEQNRTAHFSGRSQGQQDRAYPQYDDENSTSEKKIEGPKDQRRKEQVCRAVKKYRTRKKEELEYLRQRVKDLEGQLQTLQQKGNDSSQPLLGKRSSGDSGWEFQAREEAKRRVESERENEILKHEVISRIQFAQSLQELLTHTSEINFFPSMQGNSQANNSSSFLRLVSDYETRRKKIYEVTDLDIMETPKKLLEAGLSLHALPSLPMTNSRVTDIEGIRQIEVTKAIFYAGYTAEQVADVICKIFWAEVDLPDLPGGNKGIELENLDPLDPDTLYCRFVCTMGTKTCQLPGMEKLVIRRRVWDARGVPTIVWRTVVQDDLHPHTGKYPRVNEDGCLTIENSTINGQSGALLRMMIHVKPPLHTLNLPSGAVIESYLSGFVDYVSEVEQLIGLLLLMSTISFE